MREPRHARAEASSAGPGRFVLLFQCPLVGQPTQCSPPQNRIPLLCIPVERTWGCGGKRVEIRQEWP